VRWYNTFVKRSIIGRSVALSGAVFFASNGHVAWRERPPVTDAGIDQFGYIELTRRRDR
jgi:hypothetical protein